MAGKSEEFKIKVVQNFMDIEDKKGAITQISKYYNISKTTLRNWIKKYKTDREILILSTHGRKSKFSQKVDKKIKLILESPQPMTSKLIQQKMGKLGQGISNRTFRRYLSLADATFKSVQKIPILKKEHILKRFQFASKMKDANFNNIIFSDECNFQTHSITKKAWMLQNTQKKLWFQHIPKKFMFGDVFLHLDLDHYLFLRAILILEF